MADRPKVSRVTVKVPGVDPEIDIATSSVKVYMQLEAGSAAITEDQYFLIVMLTPENTIYKYPPALNKTALTGGTYDSMSGTYVFESTHPFLASTASTFHKLKFSWTAADDKSWSNLEKLVPEIYLTIDKE